MKRFTVSLLTALVVAGGLSLTMSPLAAQSRAKAVNVPVIPHEAVPGFFKNPPGIYTGENMGISTDSKGNIYIYHRAGETRLFQTIHRQVRRRSAATATGVIRALGPRRRPGQHLDG